jgi:hypothetical protein
MESSTRNLALAVWNGKPRVGAELSALPLLRRYYWPSHVQLRSKCSEAASGPHHRKSNGPASSQRSASTLIGTPPADGPRATVRSSRSRRSPPSWESPGPHCYRLATSGLLPVLELGRRRVVPAEWLRRWLEDRYEDLAASGTELADEDGEEEPRSLPSRSRTRNTS